MTPGSCLHPYAVMSYLPYRTTNSRKPSKKSSSSSCSSQTFSSSNSSFSMNDDDDSAFSYESDSSSSLKSSFEVPEDAPKCHRGHIHKQKDTALETQEERAVASDCESQELQDDHFEDVDSCSCDTCKSDSTTSEQLTALKGEINNGEDSGLASDYQPLMTRSMSHDVAYKYMKF